MRKEYKELFDKLSPVRGDDELLKAVLDRKAENNMGTKKFSKNIFIPVIAAAVLGATAVGASAAYQWSQAQAVQKVFENKGNVETDIPKYDLNKLGGKALNDVFEGTGYTIKTTGVAADDHTAYLFYDLIFDEDFDYALGESEKWICTFFPHLEMDWIKEFWGNRGDQNQDAVHPTARGDSGTLGVEDNVFHMYSLFTISGITLPNKTLGFDFMGLCRYNTVTKESEDDISKADESKDRVIPVTIDFVTTESTIVKPNKRVTLESGLSGELTYAEISPFTLSTRILWDEHEETAVEDKSSLKNGKFEISGPVLDEIMTSLKIKFKDGTVKDINAFAANNYSNCESLMLAWEYPVEVDQIESITIGDVDVKF